MYIPFLVFIIAFAWYTKDYDKSWSTWRYRWLWTEGLIVAEIIAILF